METRLRLFYETKSGPIEFRCKAGSKGKINPMEALQNGTITLALLVGMVSAAVANPNGSAWITDGLTSAQRQEIRQGASKQVDKASPPASFKVVIGEAAPDTLKLQPMPKSVSDQVPAVKPYDFAMLENRVLIVDPKSKEIIDIIPR